MEEVWLGGLLTLGGIVIGAVLTYWFARRTQVTKTLHDARIAACSRFCATVLEYRHELRKRWHSESSGSEDSEISGKVYETRAAALAAAFQVQLLCGETSLGERAHEALKATTQMREASDRNQLNQQAAAAKVLVSQFIDAARHDIAAQTRVK